jgi:RNA polymerase sigma-70 factor (ECF subfamily)
LDRIVADLATQHHDELRPLMFSIAYRMLGSVTEAEDIVQEAFARMVGPSAPQARSPEALASTVTTRLAIDHLRSARVRRERYVGAWLPEPLITADGMADPAQRIEVDETVSMAFLILLENLTPVERAVFLLRDVFDYDYSQVAEIVGKSEANCRQILTRARQRIEVRRPRFEASRDRRDQLARQFLAACETGDTAALERLLAEDVVFYGDGGGKVAAVARPVVGGVRVARFVLAIGRQVAVAGGRFESIEVNGQPGARLVDAEGRLGAVLELTIVDGHVRELRNILNPDKLRHLGLPLR